MDNNLVVWAPQVTVDRTFTVPNDVEPICRHFVREGWFARYHDALSNIANQGLRQDYHCNLDHEPGTTSDRELGAALTFLRANHQRCERSQVGGNPAIAALTHYYLGTRKRDSSLPRVKYAGLYPRSLQVYVADQRSAAPEYFKIIEDVLDRDLCVAIGDSPMTLALEGLHNKLMLAYGPGRSLEPIRDPAVFANYLAKLRLAVERGKASRVLFALSIPNPPEEGVRLVDELRDQFGARALFFISCSSFRTGTVPNFERIRRMQPILERADIISMNETELVDLHSLMVGNGNYQDKPLSYKLLELPLKAVKVCHGDAGTIMDAGPDPGRVVSAGMYRNDPAAFLEESLRLATDGATFGIASPRGHDAAEDGVRVFSATVRNRNAERFSAMFLNVLETMPPGLIAVHTPVIARKLSTITGIGARFDGLLAAFLMRA